MISSSSAAVQTRADVQHAIGEGGAVVDRAIREKRLTDDEASAVKNVVRKVASTTFGTRHEDAAIG